MKFRVGDLVYSKTDFEHQYIITGSEDDGYLCYDNKTGHTNWVNKYFFEEKYSTLEDYKNIKKDFEKYYDENR
jgi:hypothetical protein